MKKLLLALMTAVVLSALLSFATYADDVTVTLNGETVDCASYGQEATIVEGRTLVPLRAIFEALGASVEWDGETRTVDSKLGETEISLTIGENKLIKNGEEIALDVPAMIMNGRTLVPVRAVSESFGVEVEWDGEKRIVTLSKIADETEPDNTEENEEETLPKTKAYGDFYFGMTKEDVLKELASTGASEFDNEISVSFSEECKEVDNRITGDAVIEDMKFEFENGILNKMILFTEYDARHECVDILEDMTEYYGEPTDKKKSDEEYIWVVDGGNVKVTATLYCLENTLLIDPNYGYYVEIQIKYTGNTFDEPEEKEEEAESEEKEYIYGKFYFGMKYDEALEVSGRPEDGDDKPSVQKNSEEDVSYITLKDTNAKYVDEDESITGKVNVETLELGFAKERLYDIFISTDYAMTREEADAVLTGLIELYKEPSISIDSLQNYEWVNDKVQIKLDIFKKTTEDNSEAFGINLRYTEGGFKKDVKFNILDQMPLGLELQRVIKAFEARVELGENRIEFFDVYDPAIHELRSYTTINGFDGNVSFNTVKEPYRPENDIFGQNFKCNYISLDLVDGVYDNCFVRTGATYRASAVETMKYVAKYLGLENAVFDEENLRYEWKDYNFRGKNGISKVNIYSGIAEAEYDRYYCYISIQIADNGRYSFVDEEGRIAGYDYPHAYGNFYFGMTVEQAEAVIKGEKEANDYVLRINDFDDEDETITGNINFDNMEVLFDSTTKVLCGVRTSGVNVSEEQTASVLEGLRAYYGETDEEKESSVGKAYSWVLRGKNALVNFEVVKDESIENVYVCSYSIILAGSRIADV